MEAGRNPIKVYNVMSAPTKKVTIATHSGGFHADDVFAVATLLLLLGEDKVQIIRSRSEDIIATADYVVDVGFVYDPETNRFDHHQEGGAGTRENGIPYASFGLVWKKFGYVITKNENVVLSLDKKLVQAIDGPDTGYLLFSPSITDAWPYTITNAVASFEPDWGSSSEKIYEAFRTAVSVAKNILVNEIRTVTQEQNALYSVEKIYKDTKDKRLISFEGKRGWSRVFLSMTLARYAEPLFFIREHYDGTWQLVTIQEEGYKMRKALPMSWAGKEGAELAKATGISGALFCHSGRFMCIAQTKEDIDALAQKALEA